MTTYTLLGFMGAGKSYWGKQLARHFQADFIDLDDYIVTQARQSIPDIFATQGEAAFRRMETHLLHQLLLDTPRKRRIIALGGGTPIAGDNMTQIRTHSTAIYLQATPALLAQRLFAERQKRPLLRNLTDDQLLPFITQKLAERAPIYQKAHHTIDLQAPTTTVWVQLLRILEN